MWLAEKGSSEVVKSEWGKQRSSNTAEGIVTKIKDYRKALKQWSCKNFGSI